MNNRGSVTVYFVLIFSVLIILVTSVISVLRYESEKMNSLISLNVSQESAFGKYYRPLLNEYGMYYYIADSEEKLSADIMGYVTKNQSGITRLLSFEPGGLDITKMYYATDDEAANVRHQMRAVIKDTFAQDKINKFMEKYRNTNISGNNDKINECRKRVKEDIDEAKQEKKVLELLRLVEGVTVSGGKIKCSREYAKCGLAGKVTSANAGIDNPDIWNAVKDNSFDMTEYLVRLNSRAKKAIVGKKVTYSERKTLQWCNRVKRVYEITVKAKNTAGTIGKLKGGICNPQSIEKGLTVNIPILEALLHLEDIKKPESVSDWQDIYALTTEYIKLLKRYHVKDMAFDYSTLNLKRTDNPAAETDGDVNDIITYLIQNKDGISKKHIAAAGVYEQLAPEKEKKIPGIDFEDIEGLAGTLDKCLPDQDKNDSADSLYIQMYIDRFFSEYVCSDNADNRENDKKNAHVLDYEKEYIINAGVSDRDNLKAVVYRILMIRMGTSFVYLAADDASRQKAYVAAASIVGFTGLDAVVRCVQYLILAAWAYQDACIDTGAVLSGKSIPMVKNGNNLNIQFNELVLFSKENMRNKINDYKSKKGMSYDEYINLFLLGTSVKKRIYRSMDIIQYNMKKNHDSLFSFQNAVCGADMELICEKPFYYVAKSGYMYK